MFSAFRQSLLISVLVGFGICRWASAASPYNDYGPADKDLRTVVDRTQTDLRTAFDLSHGNKQTDRYHKAQDHLSKFDKSLSHRKFDKGALNDSIDLLKSILDHNTIQAKARDALMQDLTDLKVARARR